MMFNPLTATCLIHTALQLHCTCHMPEIPNITPIECFDAWHQEHFIHGTQFICVEVWQVLDCSTGDIYGHAGKGLNFKVQ